MNKLHTLILMCLLSLVGISANAQEFHPCDANHDGTVDVADIAITANYILTGEYQSDEPSDDPYNGHEYVDLGLSVKWATCNVGAVSPEDYGDYFAWGETEPKDYYDWSTYKWCNGSNNTLTKYCTSPSYGTVDNKTVLDPEDDAAHVNWGGDWRMPTPAEQEELINNCTWKWTTQNGVKGYTVTSNINGNSIFLPAAGYCLGGDVRGQGYYGYYWSSTSDGSIIAYGLHVNSGSQYVGYDSRKLGYSVRAVCQDQVPSITLSADSTKIMIGKTFQLTATGTPLHAIQTVTWTSSNPSVATVSESGLVKGVGTGTAVITATTAEGGLTATCNVEVVEPDYNGHEYVDLGLPSGLLWATCNVGADAPEDYGDYFAWGETEPEPKDYYDWSTYKWCNGSYDTQTKYGTDSYFGTVDNKTVLDPEDDAAHVNWGGDWRMPTKAELEELLNNCTWKWTTQNGANGCKVTSNINGNSIFLPAAGYGYYGDVLGLGNDGRYWSSTHDGSSHAYDLRFGAGSQSVFDISRFSGYSVRAVLSE
ncbi:MAG: Ig-like domain-containing protein [Prevotellaceae bacterium]|nr:Ig-like domain-containing protein [Candidatus Colivivens caballi]